MKSVLLGMLCLNLLLFAEDPIPGKTIELADYFRPVHKDSIATTPRGEMYFLNTSEKMIVHMSPDGKVLKTFSQKGVGPGELNRPHTIQYFEEKLYVNDGTNVTSFNLDGSYVDTYKKGGWENYHRVSGGWLLAQTLEGKQWVVKKSDDGALTKILDCGPETGMINIGIDEGKVTFTYNPAENRFLMAGHGRTYYAYSPNSQKISVIDAAHGKVTATITFPEKAMRFDEEWGRAKVKERAENVKLNGKKATANITPDFPDYFPLVSALEVDHLGRVHAMSGKSLWAPNAAKSYIFNPKGELVSEDGDYNGTQRIVQVRDAQAWVTCFDKEEEVPFLKVVPLAKVKDLIAAVGNYSDDSGTGFSITTN